MVLQNDNFNDNSIDAFWTKVEESEGTVTEQNEQLECNNPSSNDCSGLVTASSHDLTTCDAQVDVNNDNCNSQDLFICLTKITTSNPHPQDNWYRIIKYNLGDDYYVQKRKDGGDVSTLATGEWTGASGSLRITISSGTIKLYEEATERASESYDLSNYDCYLYIITDTGAMTGMDVFDNFLGSSGAVGVTIPVMIHHYKQAGGL